jgi:hypothetical protein
MVENHDKDDGDPRVQRIDSRAHFCPAARRKTRIGGQHGDYHC